MDEKCSLTLVKHNIVKFEKDRIEPPFEFKRRVDTIGLLTAILVAVFFVAWIICIRVNYYPLNKIELCLCFWLFVAGLFGFSFSYSQVRLYLYARWIKGRNAGLRDIWLKMREIAKATDFHID